MVAFMSSSGVAPRVGGWIELVSRTIKNVNKFIYIMLTI
jgi:hypothetical protein